MRNALPTVAYLGADEFFEKLANPGVGLRLGSFNAHIQSNAEALRPSLFELYRDFPLIESPSVYHFHIKLRQRRGLIARHRRMVRFTVDGQRPHDDMPASHAPAVLEWGINLVVALRFHCFFMLHAAVLERGGRGLVLPAAPGFGKTTLCAGLALAGWRLLSDEFGLIRRGSGVFTPAPRPLALKNESIELMRRLAPDTYISPPVENTRKGTVAHMRPPMDSVQRANEEVVPAWLVFPRWKRESDLDFTEVPRGEAFMALASNAFNYDLLGQDGFTTAGQLISSVRCFRMTYSNLAEAVQFLDRLT